MGDVTDVRVVTLNDRVSKLESKMDQHGDDINTFFRTEWSKIDRMADQITSLLSHMAEDKAEHKKLEARVLKCETSIIQLKGDVIREILGLEKKFLKWVAISAAVSGGAGASILKALSMF